MTLMENFGRFLNSHYDYSHLIQLFKLVFSKGMVHYKNLSLGTNLTTQLLSEYPRYKFPFLHIVSWKDFNLYKIKNISQATVYQLEKLLSDDLEFEKMIKFYKKFPHVSIEDFVNDIYLQHLCFDSVNSLFYSGNFLKADPSIKNNFSNLFWSNFTNDYLGFKENSYILSFSLMYVLEKVFKTNITFFETIVSKVLTSDLLDNSRLKVEFDDFIDKNIEQITKDIIDLDLSLVQGLINYHININSLVTQLRTKILNYLKTSFSDFLVLKVLDSSGIFIDIFSQICLERSILDTLNYIYNNKNIFFKLQLLGENKLDELCAIDYDRFTQLESQISLQSLWKYMLFAYSYKHQHFKFINLIPFLIARFVDDLFETEEIVEYYRNIDISPQLNQIIKLVDNSQFDSFLMSDEIKTIFVNNLKQKDNLLYSFYKYIIYIMDEFVEYIVSQTDIIEDILKDIYNLLIKLGLRGPYDDWMRNYLYIKLYLKALFRNSILNGISAGGNVDYLFESLLEDLKTVFQTFQESNLINNIAVGNFKFYLLNLKEKYYSDILWFVQFFERQCLTNKLIINNLAYYLLKDFQFITPSSQDIYSINSTIPIFWTYTGMSNYLLSLYLYKLEPLDPAKSGSLEFPKFVSVIVENIPVNYEDINGNQMAYNWQVDATCTESDKYLIIGKIYDGSITTEVKSSLFSIVSQLDSSIIFDLISPPCATSISPLDESEFNVEINSSLEISWSNLTNREIFTSIHLVNAKDLSIISQILDNKRYTESVCKFIWRLDANKYSKKLDKVRLCIEVRSEIDNFPVQSIKYTKPFQIIQK